MKRLLSVLLIFSLVGCFATMSPTMQKVSASVAAKMLGQELKGKIHWDSDNDKFIDMIASDGITIYSGDILYKYAKDNIPELYHSEVDILLADVGFEFSSGKLFSVSKVNKSVLVMVLKSFKAGLGS